jgi:hypothetical protein
MLTIYIGVPKATFGSNGSLEGFTGPRKAAGILMVIVYYFKIIQITISKGR